MNFCSLLMDLLLRHKVVLLDGEALEDVDKVKYLGSMFALNGQGTEEVISRTNLTRSTFLRLQSCLWSRREILFSTKDRVYQAAVISILLDGMSSRRTDVGGL